MLIRFEVENFKSIREPAELSMVALDERDSVFHHDKFGESLVPVAGVFGPNASGKTNILSALYWLCNAIRFSVRQWDEEIPIEPFAFGEVKNRESSFALDIEIDGVRFEYLLDVGKTKVSYEALFHYPEGRRRRIFERENNVLTLRRGLGQLAGTRALLTDRVLAISLMKRFDETDTKAFFHAVLNICVVGNRLGRSGSFLGTNKYTSTINLFDSSVEDSLDDEMFATLSTGMRDRALALLRLADLGVSEVEILEEDVPVSESNYIKRKYPKLLHGIGSESFSLDYKQESSGTKSWFRLIGPLLGALEHGSIVLFDEIDANLHPTLTAQIVQLFQNRASNPRGAQLIFTSHDTNLLNYLNRDEVWLTQKDPSGNTKFAALSDFAGERVRKSANLEIGYRSGKFGALPNLSNPQVLRDLGLIS